MAPLALPPDLPPVILADLDELSELMKLLEMDVDVGLFGSIIRDGRQSEKGERGRCRGCR